MTIKNNITMSLKRQLQFKYQNFVNALKSFSLPGWMTGVACRATLSAVVLLLGSAYVFQTSSAATRGYEMANLERQMASLETDMQKINVAVAKASSLTVLDAKLKDSKMVAVSTVKHLNVNSGEMALR